MAGLLAAGYNEQNAAGEIMRQAAEQDIAARERVETFNRGTNAMNAQLGLQTYAANQKNQKKDLMIPLVLEDYRL